MTALTSFIVGIGAGAFIVRVVTALTDRMYRRGYADARFRTLLTTYHRPRGGYTRCSR